MLIFNLGTSMSFKRSRTVKAPVASSSTVRFEAAQRVIQLVGREYVTLVSAAVPANGSSVYNTTSQLLRPTDTRLFSWMSGIAEKFEKYKFTKLCFTYEPQCPTSTSGSVAMWFDPDPTHTVPSTWGSMINTGVNSHGAPWTGHKLDIPARVSSSRREYYTKSEFPDANAANSKLVGYASATPTDPMEYFAGIYGFATQDIGPGGAAAVQYPVGKVYLDYAIILQVQAVDHWNLTSMVKFLPISAEPAANSGTGLILKQIAPFPAASAMQYLLGFNPLVGVAQTLSYSQGGCQYFNFNHGNKIVTVLNDVDLAVSAGISASATPNTFAIHITRGANADVAAGTLYSILSGPGGQAAAIAGVWSPHWQYPAGLANSFNHYGQVRLYSGDQIAIYCMFAAAQSISDANLHFSPQPFGIAQ